MDCTEVASRLVEVHFGALDDDDRLAVEEHLVACTPCLRTYLALKRAAEARPIERPSASVKARLRAEVAQTFNGAPKRRPLRTALLARRIPLYQGLALAAVAAALAFAAPNFARRVSMHVGDGAPEVDTSRPRAESLRIY